MRRLCGIVALVAAALSARTALALNVPTPTVSTPTVTAPSVTVPSVTVSVPTAPVPTVPAPKPPVPTVPVAPPPAPKAPTVPTPTPTVSAPTPRAPTPPPAAPLRTVPGTAAPAPATPVAPAATGPTPTAPAPAAPAKTSASPGAPAAIPASAPATPRPGAAGGGSASSGSASSGPVSPGPVSSGAGPAQVVVVQVPATVRRVRPVVAAFTVRVPRVVRVSVRELAPRCRAIGSFRYAAKRGTNRVRLPARVGRRRVGLGTFALVGRTLRGRKLFGVVADVRRDGGRLLARRVNAAPVCAQTAGVTVTTTTGAPGTTAQTTPSPASPKSAAGIFQPPALDRHRSPIMRAATFQDAPAPLRPLLFALLALSIGLLALSAVPQQVLPAGAAAGFVTTKRAYLAAAGVWLLAVVAALTLLL